MTSPGDIDAVFVDLGTKLRKFKMEFALEMLDRIRSRTPVLTGKLKDGWGQTQRSEGFDIWNVQDYAGYVEYGTIHFPPRGMIRTTMLEKDQIAQIAKERAGVK